MNAVYSSGVQTNKEGKEKLVFKCFEAELALLNERRGRCATIIEYAKGEFGRDNIRASTKNSFLTSEKIWEKGMASRRKLITWLAEYGRILNFTVLRPMVEAKKSVDKSKFDLELNEDSGGNADLELLKILRKVHLSCIIRMSRVILQSLKYLNFFFSDLWWSFTAEKENSYIDRRCWCGNRGYHRYASGGPNGILYFRILCDEVYKG